MAQGPSKAEETKQMFMDLQARFEGKIECVCGNQDWKDFLYMQAGDIIAACKLCSQTQKFKHETETKSL